MIYVLLQRRPYIEWAGPGWSADRSIADRDKNQEIKLRLSRESSNQSRFCGSKHLDRGHKWQHVTYGSGHPLELVGIFVTWKVYLLTAVSTF